MTLRTTLLTLSLLMGGAAYGQQDADNLAGARAALDGPHKCDEAMRLLNLVSIDNRQTADYLLCMGKTQDCMKNNAQALYYYNKYLALKPADDSIKRRTAELTDQKTKETRTTNQERNANDLYKGVTKHRKKRHHDLDDNYYSTGMGYGLGMSGVKSPYKSILRFEATDGFVIMDNHAVLDINASTGFLLSPNETWFNGAFAPGGVATTGAQVGSGFSGVITMGFSPVLVNNKDIALTAGAVAGVDFYVFPLSPDAYYSNASIGDKIMFCYGIKSNLYIGQHFMVFANILLHPANTATVTYGSYATTVVDIPANYNSLTLGAAVKFDSWW